MADERPVPEAVPAPQGPQQIRIQHVDSVEPQETFADAIDHIHFDGQTLRLYFGVTRVEPVANPTYAKRHPACRLVLSSGAAVELMNQMQRLKETLLQAGVLKL